MTYTERYLECFQNLESRQLTASDNLQKQPRCRAAHANRRASSSTLPCSATAKTNITLAYNYKTYYITSTLTTDTQYVSHSSDV